MIAGQTFDFNSAGSLLLLIFHFYRTLMQISVVSNPNCYRTVRVLSFAVCPCSVQTPTKRIFVTD